MKAFGTQFYGQYTAFRLNCKITDTQCAELADSYPHVNFQERGRGLTCIEGAMSHEQYHEFKLHLAIELAIYKAQVAQRLVDELQEMACSITAHADDMYEDDLPF